MKVLFIGGTGEISTACVRRIVGEMADDPGNRPDLGGRHLFAHG